MTKISIIVPIYNSEPYLKKCIDSLINQTYKNIEILLIDDGSDDNSLAICLQYACSDERIKVFHKDNEGLVLTRQYGIKKADGEYFLFVDSDDYIDDFQVEFLVKYINKKATDIVMFNLIEEYTDHKKVKNNHFEPGLYVKYEIEKILYPQMLSYGEFFDFGILPNIVCKLIKKDFYQNNIPFINPDITLGEDALVTFQLMMAADSVWITDIASYHYVKRSNSMMGSKIVENSIENLTNTLYKIFNQTGFLSVMKQQLYDYKCFLYMLKEPWKILAVAKCFRGKKVALYGAGGCGQSVYFSFRDNILFWIDKRYETYREGGMDVISMNEFLIHECEVDFIFIAITDSSLCEIIKKELMNLGIKREIIYFKPNYQSGDSV